MRHQADGSARREVLSQAPIGNPKQSRAQMYTELKLYVDGEWFNGGGRKGEDVLNPATGKTLANLPHASKADLDQALTAAEKGLCALACDLGLRSRQDHAQGGRSAARALRRRLENHDAGAGQGLCRGARGGARHRRHHRLVRRGGPQRPTAASFPAAAKMCASSSSRSRSASSRRSRRGIFRR